MTPVELKLKCIELAMPKTINDPDPAHVIRRAQAFYEFVMTDTAQAPAPSRPILTVADTGKPPRKP